MPDKYSLLRRYWKTDTFRPLQEEAVDAVATGRDVLVLMPTGGGKSLCYQMPALMREGVCLIVSPLVALIKDQVQQLNDKHLKASCLISSMSSKEITTVLYNTIAGQIKYLYVTPERLRSQLFIEHFRRMTIGMIAVDEAHCISQWGYDFRPTYLQIADIRAYHPTAPLVALTATATPQVADDIRQRLLMRQPLTLQSSFFRPNLAYSVEHCPDKLPRIVQLVQQTEGSVIVYVRSRRLTVSIANLLCDHQVGALAYHAGLPPNERDNRQRLWTTGGCRVMVATNAFGMGIDKADVHLVLHIDLPDSLEAYFQEAGRAGRDGSPSRAILLCDEADIKACTLGFDADFPPLPIVRNIYRALCNYYKLPLGSGANTHYDFDLETICSTYRLKPRVFFGACRLLEREGLIALPDHEEAYSRLFIPLHRDELYRFQVNHQVMGQLLVGLSRLYPSLFSESVGIDEKHIASRLTMNESDVRSMLRKMHEMHVVDYQPQPKGPQIYFPTARIDESEIFLSNSHYPMLKEAAHHRLQAMLDYATCNNQCRSQKLLSYFGETPSNPCGHCDVCLATSHEDLSASETIKRILGKMRLPAADVARMGKDEGLVHVEEVLRTMLDEGQLGMDLDGRLYVC